MQLYGSVTSFVARSSAGSGGKQQDRFLWSRYSTLSPTDDPEELKVQAKYDDTKYHAPWWESHAENCFREVSTERKQRFRECEPGAGISRVDSVVVEVEGLVVISWWIQYQERHAKQQA